MKPRRQAAICRRGAISGPLFPVSFSRSGLRGSLIPWAPFVVVNAPRSLVFDAFTEPEHPKRWMGPRAFPMVHCESDLRVGGGYRFVHRGSDGQEVVFHGN